jgi:hypothetical protein
MHDIRAREEALGFQAAEVTWNVGSGSHICTSDLSSHLCGIREGGEGAREIGLPGRGNLGVVFGTGRGPDPVK